jgi:hypothetical protein
VQKQADVFELDLAGCIAFCPRILKQLLPGTFGNYDYRMSLDRVTLTTYQCEDSAPL